MGGGEDASDEREDTVLLDDERTPPATGGETAVRPLGLREAAPIFTTDDLPDPEAAAAMGREFGLTLPIGLLPLLEALRSRSAIPIALPGIRTADRPRVGGGPGERVDDSGELGGWASVAAGTARMEEILSSRESMTTE